MTRPARTTPLPLGALGSGALAVGALLLGACAGTPERTDDAMLAIDVPAAWSTVAPDALGATDDTVWWAGFGDESLPHLVTAALEHNRDLRAAAARLAAAVSNRTIADAAGWPEADASFDPQRSKRLFLGFPFGGGGVPSSTTTTFGLSLNVRWEIDLWGRLRAGKSAAIADLQAAAADHAAARTSLTAQVCKAYFAVVEARQQVRLAEGTVAAFTATAEDVRDRYRRGVRPALDVHLAETNLANAAANVAQRRDVLQRALRQVELLTGRYPDATTATATTMPPSLPRVPASLPGELLQRRPDLVAAERRLAAAGCRVDAAKAALYPRLSLTGSAGTSSEELEDLVDDDFRVWSLGGNLLLPLLRGGALRGEVDRRSALETEALAVYGDAVLQAFTEVESSLASEALLAERREGLSRAADHAGKARDLARDRWQLGLVDFLAVADGQRQSYLADAALITIERQRLDNRIDLFLALGGGFPPPDGPATAGANP